jgi:hypothetical protein
MGLIESLQVIRDILTQGKRRPQPIKPASPDAERRYQQVIEEQLAKQTGESCCARE